MSFFNVFFFIENVLIYDFNDVCVNKLLFLYLVSISFLKQKIYVFYLLKFGIFHLRGLVRTGTNVTVMFHTLILNTCNLHLHQINVDKFRGET